MTEIWKPVVGFEGAYEVSSLGRVRSLDRIVKHWRGGPKKWMGRMLSPSPNRDGYLTLTLTANGDVRNTMVHNLVAEAFVPNSENLPEVDHKNLDRANNSVDNLQWVARVQNVPRGERMGSAKLTEEDVINIRAVLATKEFTQKELAEEYGVDSSLISRIKNRIYWTHI